MTNNDQYEMFDDQPKPKPRRAPRQRNQHHGYVYPTYTRKLVDELYLTLREVGEICDLSDGSICTSLQNNRIKRSAEEAAIDFYLACQPRDAAATDAAPDTPAPDVEPPAPAQQGTTTHTDAAPETVLIARVPADKLDAVVGVLGALNVEVSYV